TKFALYYVRYNSIQRRRTQVNTVRVPMMRRQPPAPAAIPRPAYRNPLLRVMYMLGLFENSISVEPEFIVRATISDMARTGIIGPRDLEAVDTGMSQESRASKHIHWQRKECVDLGYITERSRGEWSLTSAGAAYVNENKLVDDNVRLAVASFTVRD